MKKLFLLIFITTPFFAKAQATIADPALEPMKITTVSNNVISVSQLPLNGIIKLKVPILNRNIGNALPTGSCKVKIGLGSKLSVNPSFNLATVNTSQYFNWTTITSGGQVQIIGDLINTLPANFKDTAYFDLKGIILGNSTITTNFLVTNHNTSTTLSDEDGANNTAAIAYTIIAANVVVPVTFTNIFAENKNCALEVQFEIENEININNYDLEISKDFLNFEKINTLKANNQRNYTFKNYTLPEKFQISFLLVRVKSIDIDGKFHYTEIKKISGVCDLKKETFLYPNPILNNNNSFYFQKQNGTFNGKYVVTITDMAGKLVETGEVNVTNLSMIRYEMKQLTAGQYIIKLFKKNSNNYELFKIIKQ